MSKSKTSQATQNQSKTAEKSTRVERSRSKSTRTERSRSMAFSFGDPEPILDTSMVSYLGVYLDTMGDYYQPPIDLTGLAKLMGANAYHGPILHFKKNMVLKWYEPSSLLSAEELRKLVLNYIATGNGYLQKITNRFGTVTKLISQPSITMRRGKQPGQFFKIMPDGSNLEFLEDEIIHLLEYDLIQDIYGVPEFLGGIQSVLLTEDMTLFRRKYILNGQHMGYILVTNDADIDDDTAKAIETQIKQSKGPGNGRSLYLNIARSNAREPVQIIPVGNIGTKDDYEKIKGITEREMLAMHRMQPGLSGVIPEGMGFGDMNKIKEVYYDLEVTALQQPFLELNNVLNAPVVSFSEPLWKETEE